MKVSELITKLQELDQDMMIVISGYEAGYDFPNSLEKVNIVPNENTGYYGTQWYYGAHSLCNECVEGEWNAYLLGNTND